MDKCFGICIEIALKAILDLTFALLCPKTCPLPDSYSQNDEKNKLIQEQRKREVQDAEKIEAVNRI